MKMSFVKNKKCLQIILILNLVLFASSLLPIGISAQKTVDKKLPPREIAQQTLPSTVLLVMGNGDTEEMKSGSGFFVAEDVVVTNFHVIEKMTEGYAKIYGQEKIYDISGIVGTDEKNDLALLKIKGIKGKPLKLNTDDSAAIGDEVFAVGNPKGLEGTFSQGIVSSIRKTGKFNLLQITASISSGSSGGAVLNDKGEVIGVAVGAIESGQSLNFAIPVLLLRNLVSTNSPLKPLISNQISSKPNQVSAPKNTQLPKNEFPKRESKKFESSKLQENTLNWTSLFIFGRAKTIITNYYLPIEKFGKQTLDKPVAKSVQNFNSDGYIINDEDIIYAKEGLEETYSNSYYKENGKKEFPFTKRTEYSYNFKDNQRSYKISVKCASCINYKFASGFTTKYNINEEITFQPNGELLGKKITDESGNQKIEYDYDNEGKLLGKYIETNNNLGRELKMYSATTESIFDNSKERELELFSHRIFQEEEIQGDIKLTTINIENGKQVRRSVSVRNKDTNLTIYSEENGKVLKYLYEFDKQGNWIKQTEFEQVDKFGKTYFEQLKVKIRTITYY